MVTQGVRHIALLRGINVGGNRIIKMADLRDMFVAAGAREVQTYIQSGNVVFSHPQPTAARFEKVIARETGFDVPVILRTADEFAALAHPFENADHVYVYFCAVAPALARTLVGTPPEALSVKGREVFVYLPDGAGRSKLAGALGKALPAATARNWRTVQQLSAMAIQSAR
jgi:uncharacterized protein (DUF1697 family)